MFTMFMSLVIPKNLYFLPALTAAAPLIGGAFNYFANRETNSANIDMANQANQTNIDLTNQSNQISQAEAQKNRDFQAKQSASAYQTAVKDMRAAGLNPALAYQQGGASAMSGGTAQTSTARVDAPRINAPQIDGSGLSAGFASAQQAKMNELNYGQQVLLNESARKTQETTQDTNIASAQKINQDRLNSVAELALKTNDQKLKQTALNQTLKNQQETARLTNLQAHTTAARLGGVQADSDWSKAQSEYKTKHANVIVPLSVATDQVGRVTDGISSALNIFNMFKPKSTTTTERIDPRTGEIIQSKTKKRR